jgi:formate dehydrogenase major subunit
MPHRVDAAMERNEKSASDAPVDRPRRHAQREQLRARRHSVLLLRERSNRITACLTAHTVVRGAVVGGFAPAALGYARNVTGFLRQLRGDPLGLGKAAQSRRSAELIPRTKTADRVVQSICPYCAVGCGQKVYVKDEQVVQIEGDPDSPISRGRLCPKGAASEAYVNSPIREHRVKYRRPCGTEWEELDLDTAMDMIAERVIRTRAETWEDCDERCKPLRRTLGLAVLGGATLDSEENYLMKKFFSAAGAVSIENQARI